MLAVTSGGLVLYLGFSSGGFFPGATGVAAAAVAVLLVLHLTLAERPLAGLGASTALVAAALAVLAAVTVVSSAWSDAPARALIEFDRTVLYLLVFLLFALGGCSQARVRAVAAGGALGAAAISVAGFLSRTLPDSFPTAVNLAESRLSHPVDYWNALGMVAALGLLLALHFAGTAGGRRAPRVAAASVTPVLCATLLLTFSRGAIAIAALGLLAYVVLGRGRDVLAAVLACAGPSAVAVVAAYDADRLGTEAFRAPAAVAQGQDLALLTLGCCIGAGLLLLVLTFAERRLEGVTLVPRPARLPLAGAVVVALVVAAFAAGAPGAAGRQFDRFVESSVTTEGTERERLTQASNNGRLDLWETALDAFEQAPVAGNGAGTYALLWARDRPTERAVSDGHSLPLEVAAELGLIGVVLIACALVTMLAALGRRAWRDGPAFAVVAAVVVMWTLHTGIDWGWEMPVVTVPVLALAGVAMARPASGREGRLGRLPRVVVALGCIVLVITPLSMARSQERLNESVRAFRAGDCGGSIDAALSSNRAMPVRPEPFQMLAFCDLRIRRGELAIAQARKAVRLDPENWEFRYSLALVQAASGEDPAAALSAARRLNPRSTVVRRAQRRLRTDDSRVRSRRARRLPLPFQQ